MRRPRRPKIATLPWAERTPVQEHLVEDAAQCQHSATEGQLCGYLMVALYTDGTCQSRSWRPNSEDHRIGNALFEAWVREAVNAQLRFAELERYDLVQGEE